MFKRALRWPRGGAESERSEDALYIVGDNVVLRDKRTEDVAEDYAWRRDPELSELDATKPMEMSYAEYRRYALEELSYISKWSRRFAIDDDEGKHIGNCMYYDIDERRGDAELGIMIGDRDYWGRGYGSDAVRTMLDYIFTSTKLTKIYLHTLTWNDRALRSFTKAGFVEVRNVRRSGMDFTRMEALKADWEEARRRAAGLTGAASPDLGALGNPDSDDLEHAG